MFENKNTYELNCEQIAELLNCENGNNYSESTYRKEYAAFNRGRNYVKHKENDRIKTRILSISDIHVPFQLPKETFQNYIDCVDILQINGDVTDCQAISKFPKTYRISPMEELIETRKYIMEIIEYINPKEVVVNYGNHDLRFQSYLAKNLDTDILELMPKTSLELILIDGFKHYNKREKTKVEYKALSEVIDGVEINYVDNWHCQIGDTIFCHPLTYSSGILKTAEKAMGYFRDEGYVFSNLIMGHTHQTGNCKIGNITIYEQGACCKTKDMLYSDGRLSRSQKEGYIYLCQDKDGITIPEKTESIRLN